MHSEYRNWLQQKHDYTNFHSKYVNNNDSNNCKYTYLFSVPEPVIHVVHEDIPITSQGHFRLSFLIEVDSSVDTPVNVDARWSGNPSLSDSPRVSITSPTVVPYSTSITFASLVSSDFGDYQIAVVVIPESGHGVCGSLQLLYRFRFSTSELMP